MLKTSKLAIYLAASELYSKDEAVRASNIKTPASWSPWELLGLAEASSSRSLYYRTCTVFKVNVHENHQEGDRTCSLSHHLRGTSML